MLRYGNQSQWINCKPGMGVRACRIGPNHGSPANGDPKWSRSCPKVSRLDAVSSGIRSDGEFSNNNHNPR